VAYLYGRAVTVPQNPSGSLNPVFRVGRQLAESIRLNAGDTSWKRRPEPADLLARVGLEAPEGVARLFPHQLSGGMAQRVVTAAGLAGMPSIVFADEPTKGLDAEARNLCLDLLRTHFGGCVLMLITHDLKAAVGLPRVAVMYAGEIVEVCEGLDFPANVLHPYSRGLVRAHPAFGLTPIAGAAPSPAALPTGCRFAPRCGQADDRCRVDHPPLIPYASDRSVRCFHADP
jgi:oligopeptide/dipeptide ABC transporter ATP-binding protein